MDGEIGKAPAARLAQPLDALAEPYLQGLRHLGHPYRFSGTDQKRGSTILVRIPLIWYDHRHAMAVVASERRHDGSWLVRRPMQTGVRLPRRHASFCKVEFSSSAPASTARDKGLNALLRAAILRIFLRTPRPVIDLLLGCFLLVIGFDKSPGIAVSTIP